MGLGGVTVSGEGRLGESERRGGKNQLSSSPQTAVFILLFGGSIETRERPCFLGICGWSDRPTRPLRAPIITNPGRLGRGLFSSSLLSRLGSGCCASRGRRRGLSSLAGYPIQETRDDSSAPGADVYGGGGGGEPGGERKPTSGCSRPSWRRPSDLTRRRGDA